MERSSVSAGLMTADPRYIAYFRDVLNLLLSHDGVYLPELVELGQVDNFATMKFTTSEANELAKKWESHPNDKPGWLMQRNQPVQVSIMMSKLSRNFNFININVERTYLNSDERTSEFLTLMEELYNVLHPAYGDIRTEEMVRSLDHHPIGMIRPGTDLLRGLPDIYWANFFGPEYVEMFGAKKMLNAPAHSVKQLDDDGMLLLASSSPLDFMVNPREFDKRREALREYLGADAFDGANSSIDRRIPRFRYLSEPGRSKIQLNQQLSERRIPSDWLSRTGRSDWESWIEKNEQLAHEFIRTMGQRGFVFDAGERVFEQLDSSIDRMRVDKEPLDTNFLKLLAAYVSQILIQRFGAKWTFRGSDDIPTLMVSEIQISPLGRAQKVILERERFDPWYKFLARELLPLMKSKNPSLSDRTSVL